MGDSRSHRGRGWLQSRGR